MRFKMNGGICILNECSRCSHSPGITGAKRRDTAHKQARNKERKIERKNNDQLVKLSRKARGVCTGNLWPQAIQTFMFYKKVTIKNKLNSTSADSDSL